VELLRAENEQLLETQRQLEAERELYAGAYQAAAVPSLVMDGQGMVRLVNEAASQLLGQDARRMLERPFRLQVHEPDRPTFRRHLERCAAERGLVTSELMLAPPGRHPFAAELRTTRLALDEPLLVVVIVDLADRVAASAERSSLREAERAARAESEAKDQFIATLSHELRTPLTPVLAAVSAFCRPDVARPPSRRVLEMIQRNVVAEARLIDDLLDASRIRRGKLRIDRQLTDVHEAVRQALEVQATSAQGKGLRLQVALEAERHHASGDALRLRQVFWNLLGNAIKFTPAGGSIQVRSWNDGSVLAVEVSDDGVGLAAESLARLFRAFEQGPDESRSPGGLGLGLAIARGVMELHDGEILATSRGPGTGARFIVRISTVPAPRDAAPAPAQPPVTAARHRRILLVEDHPDTADSLAELLTAEGYQVRKAGSAAAALAVDLERVDLVLSDLGLPDRSGHELMRELQSRRRLPGIALSGFGTEADVKASREAGFSDHLTKPIDWSALLAAIARLERA
jgi:PAS domain S-box-containing protein